MIPSLSIPDALGGVYADVSISSLLVSILPHREFSSQVQGASDALQSFPQTEDSA